LVVVVLVLAGLSLGELLLFGFGSGAPLAAAEIRQGNEKLPPLIITSSVNMRLRMGMGT
jgi:hypothetical protein